MSARQPRPLNYSQLDELLFEAIERQPSTFATLLKAFGKEFDKHAKPDRFGDLAGWRLMERRLQALRKSGRIKADRKLGWITVKQEGGPE